MSYNIEITKTETVRKKLPSQWDKVGEKEVMRETDFTMHSPTDKTRIEPVMGWTPEVDTLVDQTITLFHGTVDSLDTAVRVIEALGAKGEKPAKDRKERSDKGHARVIGAIAKAKNAMEGA